MLCLTMSFSFFSQGPEGTTSPQWPWPDSLGATNCPWPWTTFQPSLGPSVPAPKVPWNCWSPSLSLAASCTSLCSAPWAACLLDGPLSMCVVACLQPCWKEIPHSPIHFCAWPRSLGGSWPPLANIIDRGDQNWGKCNGLFSARA